METGSRIEHSRLSATDATRLIVDLEKQMKQSAKKMEFERAAMLRDEIVELRHLVSMIKEQTTSEF